MSRQLIGAQEICSSDEGIIKEAQCLANHLHNIVERYNALDRGSKDLLDIIFNYIDFKKLDEAEFEAFFDASLAAKVQKYKEELEKHTENMN